MYGITYETYGTGSIRGQASFFQFNAGGSLLSPAFELRAGGRRDANGHFWAAMGDIYIDPDRPASDVIEAHEIVDQSQTDELRYCGAVIRLRQGNAFEETIDLHDIGDGYIKDILHSEFSALSELGKKSRVFRHAFGAVYSAEAVSDVIVRSGIADSIQQGLLQDHAFMFHIRREMTAFDVIGNYKIEDDKIRRSLFREGCRQKIEEGKSAPEAIHYHRMENEEDKALMRLIGASEDIQEGMLVKQAALRNGVPVDQVTKLNQFKAEMEKWRQSYGPHASDRVARDWRAREGMQSANEISPTRFHSATVGGPSFRGGSAIKQLGDHSQLPSNNYVLNQKDELVPEETFPWAGVKRKRGAFSESLSAKGKTGESPIDLTGDSDVSATSADHPPKRIKLDERLRARNFTVLD